MLKKYITNKLELFIREIIIKTDKEKKDHVEKRYKAICDGDYASIRSSGSESGL